MQNEVYAVLISEGLEFVILEPISKLSTLSLKRGGNYAEVWRVA
jgi:hypothetical protein